VKPQKQEDGGLAQQAYLLIRERILKGELPFGTSISRRELSRELGMSTLPITEALQRLQNEALIQAVPRVGTQVRVPTRQDVMGFYVVREALESQAARLFAEMATAADREELIGRANALDQAYRECANTPHASEEQLYELRNQHMNFHLRIAEGARCPFLYEAIEKNQILVFNWFFDRLFGDPGLPDAWHADLAAVLAGHDAELADRTMRGHVRFRMDEVLVRLEPYFSLRGQHLTTALKLERKPAPAVPTVSVEP